MIRYHARWVVPIATAPIADGVVAVEGSRIAYVGPADAAPAGVDEDLGNALLMPGLVNAHCHLELTALRGFLEDLEFRQWILRLVAAKRAVLDRDALLDSARYGLEEGIRAGITSYADTSESGVGMQAMREAGVRGIMYQEVFGPDASLVAASMAGLRERVASLRYLETPLVRLGISPHAPYTVCDALFTAAAELAREQHLPMAIHIAESAAEQDLVTLASGPFAEGLRDRGFNVSVRASSPIQLLESLGVLDVAPLLIHCVRVDARDVASIVAARSAVAHCPASNAKFGHGIAPLVELLDAGATVGLGSDSMASNNRMDILEEARLGLLAQRARTEASNAPTAAEVLSLATAGGAAAIGLAGQVGTLEVGRQADLAAFSLDAIQPTPDPIAAAVFALTGARARFTCVAGQVLMRNGTLTSPRAGLGERMESLSRALGDWFARHG